MIDKYNLNYEDMWMLFKENNCRDIPRRNIIEKIIFRKGPVAQLTIAEFD